MSTMGGKEISDPKPWNSSSQKCDRQYLIVTGAAGHSYGLEFSAVRRSPSNRTAVL
jgi:hypothetical protein